MKAKELLTKAGLHLSVWGIRIIKAEEVDRFSPSNRKSANSWTTCACGKIDKNIPAKYKKFPEIGPLDSKLRSLGYDFTSNIAGNNIVEAAKNLIAIQKRSTQILKELK